MVRTRAFWQQAARCPVFEEKATQPLELAPVRAVASGSCDQKLLYHGSVHQEPGMVMVGHTLSTRYLGTELIVPRPAVFEVGQSRRSAINSA